MREQILICTDLDRTLIPNGPQPESTGARARLDTLLARPEVRLAYVSGRHRKLITQAMKTYRLPQPDFVVANVGTTIYAVGKRNNWSRFSDWETHIARDWNGRRRQELMELLQGLPNLRPQERSKQNRLKLSYYLPIKTDRQDMERRIIRLMKPAGVRARLVWSIDDPAGVGLLDILPASASKLHALEYLMQLTDFDLSNTLFCGDSGNDLEVLTSPIPSVLVANASREIKTQAREQARLEQHDSELYIASGGLFEMNGHYSGGMLEGIVHYHPHTLEWMALGNHPNTVPTSGESV